MWSVGPSQVKKYSCFFSAMVDYMPMGLSAEDTLDLSVSDRIKLVIDIWESVAEQADQIELTNETKSLLADRLESHKSNPKEGTSWSEVRRRLTPI